MRKFALILLLSVIPTFSNAADWPPQGADFILLWLANTGETHSHQLQGATGNSVMLANVGHCEAVYDKDGNLVQDGVNDGSFNYFLAKSEPIDHFIYDNLAWVKLGNSKTDSSSQQERSQAFVADLMDGYIKASAAKEPLEAVKTELNKEQQLVVDTLAEALKNSGNESKTGVDPQKFRTALSEAVAKLANHVFNTKPMTDRFEAFAKMDKVTVCKQGLKGLKS